MQNEYTTDLQWIESVYANIGGNLEGQVLGLQETKIQTHLSY